jgi:hypothetical protein
MTELPDDDYKLPCDVHLPPNTYLRKGCSLSTLITALRVRENWPDDNDKTFPALDHNRAGGAPRSSRPKVDVRELVAALAAPPVGG